MSWLIVYASRVPNMFSSRTSKEHSLRKRMVSNVYSKSSIQSSPALAAQAETILYDRFLPVLEGSIPEGGIDIYSLFMATVMDFISAYIWGLSRSTNFIDNKAQREHWLELFKARDGFGFFPHELPRLTALCKTVALHLYPSWVDAANRELAAWNTDLCRRTAEHLERTGSSGGDVTTTKDAAADVPVVMQALLDGIRREEEARGPSSPLYTTTILQKDHSVLSELWDHVLAGQETSGVALTYLSWQMSQRPRLQAQLREELLSLGRPDLPLPLPLHPGRRDPTGKRPLPDPKRLDALPLLHAIVLETLRLHTPIPGPQPRVVPRAGAKLGGYWVPGGVRIAALAYTLHRDEEVFREAEKWEPYRWLKGAGRGEGKGKGESRDDEERMKEMNRQFWAFSSGGRMCIGSHFAMHGECVRTRTISP